MKFENNLIDSLFFSISRSRSHSPSPYFPHQSLKNSDPFPHLFFPPSALSSSHTTLPTPRLDIHTQPLNPFKGISRKTRGLFSSEIFSFLSSPEKSLTRDCISFDVGLQQVDSEELLWALKKNCLFQESFLRFFFPLLKGVIPFS